MKKLLLLLLSLLVAGPAHAGDGLDVKDWLSRPGVKMLAVEFYATWCGPCKKAVPRWKALHEKYRDQGLRLVVVSVQDPDGACVNPGWNPDDVICDTDGRLAKAWGVGDRLPSAFLWSWRGSLLVRKGHVDEVKRQVEAELGRLPRVTLDEKMDPQVRDLLRTELARTGKVDVVAGAAEQAALAAIRKKSHDLKFSKKSACEIGQRLAANSLLKASFVMTGKAKRLIVHLYSAETGCQSASAGVFWNAGNPALSVAEASNELIANLRIQPELPGGAAPRVTERVIGEKEDDWEMTGGGGGVIVAFESTPPGAVVVLDGKILCQSTPCSKLVARGTHKLEVQLESYLPLRESLRITDKTTSVKKALTPDFGWVTVTSSPPGLSIKLDGRAWGVTPRHRQQLSAGPHRVLVTDPRYYDKGMEIVVERSKEKKVSLTLTPRTGGLSVRARDRRGNDLRAEVRIGGEKVGTTPWSGKVVIGTYDLKVSHKGKTWTRRVTIKEKHVTSLTAELNLGWTPPPERREEPLVAKSAPSSKRSGPFHLGAAFGAGVLAAGDTTTRSAFAGSVFTWLKWDWFRWEPLTYTLNFEGAHTSTLSTGAAFDFFKGLYVRTLFNVAFASSKKFWGLTAGLGYSFNLSRNWSLFTEVDMSYYPGEKNSAGLLNGLLGVRYGF